VKEKAMKQALPLADKNWIEALPEWAARRLRGRHRLQAMAGNSAWLFADKILRMALGLLVGVLTARALGPANYGLLNFALAFAGFFGPLCSLGLDSVLMRNLVLHPSRSGLLLGSAAGLRLMGCMAALLLALGTHSIFYASDSPGRSLLLAVLVAQLFGVQDLVDMAFQSLGRADWGVMARWLPLAVGTLWRIFLIVSGKGLIWFAWALSLESAVGAFALGLAWRFRGHSRKPWSWSARLARSLFKSSWPLALTGLSVALYMRLDQVLVRAYLGDKQLGLYSVSVRFAELWYFMPMAVCAAAYPQLLALHKAKGAAAFEAGLSKLFRSLVLLGLAAGAFLSFAGPFIIGRLYGADYAPASVTLAILAWAGIFVGLGIAREQWLILNGMAKFSFATTLGGAVLNLILNLWWLPRFGAPGAAWATLAAQAASTMILLALHPRTRPLFRLQLRAFWPHPDPWNGA
jgi:PST family polysaccharide transporter